MTARHQPRVFSNLDLKTSLWIFSIFLLAQQSQAQWLDGYEYRKQLTVDGADISGSVTNFPLLVSITDAELLQYAAATGYDIVFTDDDGTTRLNHELQSYNSGSGELLAWVQVSLSAATDKEIFMYFGNPSITADQSTTATWDANFEAVYHMEEANPLDATNKDYDLTANGAFPVAGNVGLAMQFDGADDFLSFPDNTDIIRNVGQTTVSAWIRPDDIVSEQVILGISIGSPTITQQSRVTIQFRNTQRMFIGGRTQDATTDFQSVEESSVSITAAGQWYYFTGVVDYANDELKIFLNGIEVGSQTGVPWAQALTDDTPPRNGAIGAEDNFGAGGRHFDGLIDEVRISRTLRSPDWISITYNNLNDPATFIKEVAGLEDVDGFLNGYTTRKPITIDASDVYGAEDLINFPFLISLTDNDLRSTGNGGKVESTSGHDIVFTSSTGVQLLNHELQSYDPASGEYAAWVQIPMLDYNDNTEIYVYYGRTGAVNPSTASTWDGDYAGVWHFEEDPTGTILDATSNDHDGTQVTTSGNIVRQPGKIGNGYDFENANEQKITIPENNNALDITNDMTLSAWIRPESLDAGFDGIIDKLNAYKLYINNLSSPRPAMRIIDGTNYEADGAVLGITPNTSWHLLTAVYDDVVGNVIQFYLDGTQLGTDIAWTRDPDTSASNLEFGTEGGTNDFWDGMLDEIRIQNVVRTAGWIQTEYFNQNDPGSTISVGGEELSGGSVIDDYTYTRRIIINSDNVFGSSPHVDFPVMISLTTDDLRSTANGGRVESASGFDIIFSDEFESLVFDHEIDSYDPVTGEYIAWVRIPSLPTDVDTEIRMHYGNSDATNPSTSNTWSSNYESVFHLSSESAVIDSEDGSAVTNDGATTTTGVIGNALDFVTSESDRIDLGQTYHTELANAMTLSAWVNIDDVSQDNAIIGQFSFPPESSYLLWMDTDGGDSFAFGAATSGSLDRTGENSGVSAIQDTWHYVVGTWDGSTIAVYVDGELEDSDPLSGTLDVQSIRAAIGDNGVDNTHTRFMDGQIDEVRIGSVANSADWIKTEYFNQNDPSTFYTVLDNSSDYAYQKQITIDSDRVFGTVAHADFPALVSITDLDLRSTGNGGFVESTNGHDIIFTADDQETVLDHQLESYNATTGEVVAWVRIPSLSPNTDTDFYIFYGQSGATDPSTTDTWNSDYLTVYHLNDFQDYSGNGRDLINTGTTTATGLIGGSRAMTGGAYLEDADAELYLEGLSAITMSAWVKSNAAGNDRGITIAREPNNTDQSFAIRYDDDGIDGGQPEVIKIGLNVDEGASTKVIQLESSASVQTTDWQYISFTWGSGYAIQLYIDGELNTPSDIDGTAAGTLTDLTTLLIGLGSQDTRSTVGWDGEIDEYRLSDVIRSADWIKTEYFNQSDPDNFLTVNCSASGGVAKASDSTLAPSASTTISVTDFDMGASIQWQSSTDNVSFADILGETNSSLETGPLTTTTYYRAQITAGCTSLSAVERVIVNGAEQYDNRKKMTLNGAEIVGSHSNFPVLVRLASDADLAADVTSSSGHDIIFTDANGTSPLPHELEYFNETTGELVAWVGMDLIDGTTQEFYMYYGNATITSSTQNVNGVWDDRYESVYHLEGIGDVSGNSNNLVLNGGATLGQAGIIHQATEFDGAGDYLEDADAENYLNGLSGLTLSAWVQADGLASDMGIVTTDHTIAGDGRTGMRYDAVSIERSLPETYKVAIRTDDEKAIEGQTSVASTDWTYVVMSWTSGSDPVLHVNGQQNISTGTFGAGGSGTSDDAVELRIGDHNVGDWDGLIDEVKVHNVGQSAGWITTEYNNQRIGSTMLTVGPEETSCDILTGVVSAAIDEIQLNEMVVLSVSNYQFGTTLHWQSSTDGVTFSDVTGGTGATTDNYTSAALGDDTYFRVRLNNGSCDAFTEAVLIDVYQAFEPGYRHRIPLTINADRVSGTDPLTDFPVIITISSDVLRSQINGGNVNFDNGFDLHFTLEDGTDLSYEREAYDQVNGTLRAWVKIPSLSATEDTPLYLYYGNCGSLVDPSTTDVWSSGFRSVHHMDGASGDDVSDASGNSFDLTETGSPTAALGVIGNARSFSPSSSQRFMFPENMALINSERIVSMSMWINADNLGTTAGLIGIAQGSGGGVTASSRAAVELGGSGRVLILGRTQDGGAIETFQEDGQYLDADIWHYVFATIDFENDDMTLYLDGLDRAISHFNPPFGWSGTTTDNTNSRNGAVGAQDNGFSDYFDGIMDEVRVMNVGRTAAWVQTEYFNQLSPETFVTIGDPETETVWTGGTTDWNLASNWAGCVLPTASDRARIPNTGTDPILSASATVGDLIIETGAGLTLNGNTLNVSGSLNFQGTLDASTGELRFDGNETQTIYGGSTTVNNMTIAKGSGSALNIQDNVTVLGSLTLTSGYLSLIDGDLTLNNLSSGSPNAFIVTPNDHCLRQDVGNSTVIFPVGPADGIYTPATLRNSDTEDEFCIRVIGNIYEGGGDSGTQFTEGVVGNTWFIEENTAGSSNVQLTLEWRNVDQRNNFDQSNARLTHFNSGLGSWEAKTSTAVVDKGQGRYAITASNLTDFSPHGVGSNNSILPIELLFFNAEHQGKQVLLTWATASEKDNDFFSVERAVDQEVFDVIGTVAGQGDSDSRVDYEYVDQRPLQGGSYYRLKQTDFDGTYAYSPIEFVFDGVARTADLMVYPNANDGINFNWNLRGLVPNTEVEVTLYDLNGAMITSRSVRLDGSGIYEGKGFEGVILESGIYLLKAKNNGQELVQRIMVR